MHTNSQENIVLCTRQLIQTLNGKNIEYYITGGVATRLVYCAHHNQTLSSSIFRNHGDIDVMVRFDALKDFLLLFSTNRYKIWYSGLQGVKNRNDIGEHHHISILDIASNVIIALFVYKQSEKFLIVRTNLKTHNIPVSATSKHSINVENCSIKTMSPEWLYINASRRTNEKSKDVEFVQDSINLQKVELIKSNYRTTKVNKLLYLKTLLQLKLVAKI